MRQLRIASILAISLGVGIPVVAQDTWLCQSRRPRGATSFHTTHLDSLVGVFELVLIRTVPKEWADTTRGQLELWRQDSTKTWQDASRRAPNDSVGQVLLARYLGGAFEVQPADTSYWWRRMAVRDRTYPGVEWYFGGLRFGSRDVLDGTGDNLTVEWVGPRQFGGRWRRDLGIAIIVGPDGRSFPDSEGYFCARRLGA